MVGWYTHNINCCKHFILYNQKTIVYTSMAVVGVPARISLLPSLQWADSLQLLRLQYPLQSHSPQWLTMARGLEPGYLGPMHDSCKGLSSLWGSPLAWWDSQSCVAFWGSLFWTRLSFSLQKWLTYISVWGSAWPYPLLLFYFFICFPSLPSPKLL